jgi:hypothetical protein
MLRLLSLSALALAAFGQQSGWKDLFPDETFSQWTRISIPPGKPVTQPSQWKIDSANRTLVCEGNGGHEMLRFNQPFADFVLHVEWRYTKLDAAETRYNSGIFIRNDEQGTIWHQAQAGLAGGWLFGNSPVNGEPKRFNLRAQMTENPVLPAGEWNSFDITAQGRVISLAVNGRTVSEYKECEVPKGYVALEAEGYRIEFRNLRLRSNP